MRAQNGDCRAAVVEATAIVDTVIDCQKKALATNQAPDQGGDHE
jgi:hypothetical protein